MKYSVSNLIIEIPIIKNRIKSFLNEMEFDNEVSKKIISNYIEIKEKKEKKRNIFEPFKIDSKVNYFIDKNEKEKSNNNNNSNSKNVDMSIIEDKNALEKIINKKINSRNQENNSSNIQQDSRSRISSITNYKKIIPKDNKMNLQNLRVNSNKKELISNEKINKNVKVFNINLNDESMLNNVSTIDIIDENSKIVNKIKDEMSNPAINANIKSFINKNSKKLLEIKKNHKVSFNVNANENVNVINNIKNDKEKRDEFDSRSRFSNVTKKTDYTNHVSIDISDNNIKLSDNKKRVYSVSKRESICDSSINDTFYSDANNSVLMNNKLVEYRKIKDAHDMLLEYNDLINTECNDDDKIQNNSLDKKDLVNDSLEIEDFNQDQDIKDLERTKRELEEIIINCDNLETNFNIHEITDNNEFPKQKNNDNILNHENNEKQDNNINSNFIKCNDFGKKLTFEGTLNINKINSIEDLDDNKEKILKEKLKNEIGINLFDCIWEIVDENTPKDYFFYEEETLKEIIISKLSDDFKEEKLEIGLRSIIEIYRLIFYEREKNMKLDFI